MFIIIVKPNIIFKNDNNIEFLKFCFSIIKNDKLNTK